MTEFTTPEPIELSVELAAGTVDITTTSAERTTVELSPARPDDADALALIDRARVALDGGTLVVHVPAGRLGGLLRRTPEIDVRITAPEGSTLRAATKSADVDVHGRLADARVATASGDVALADVNGELSVDAASGDVHVGTIGGSARAKTASGDISIDACAGDVRVQTASGDMRVGHVGGDVEAKTASGDVFADAVGGSAAVRTASGDVRLGGLGAGRSDINSVSGDVTLRVLPDLAVWLDVSSLSGEVRSSLDSADDGGSASTEALELAVRTVSGNITIAPMRGATRTAP